MTKFWNWLRVGLVASVAIGSLGVWWGRADYAATLGSGPNFGSKFLSSVHYASFTMCDATTGGQCAAVSASGQLSINAAASAFVSGSVLDGAIVGIGPLSSTACATDNGITCNVNALLKRLNQNITTLNTTASSPIPAGTNPIGAVALSATSTGGWTPKYVAVANTLNATNLKATAGIVHAVQVFGISSSAAYLKFYDKATSPSCGSDTPVKVVMIPGLSPTTQNGAGAVSNVMDTQFTLGIGYCVTSNITNSDTVSPSANAFVVNIDWN